MHVDEVEALAGERAAELRQRVRAQDEVRERAVPGTITDRPSGITLGGGGPGRPVRGWRTRLNEPGGSLPISRRVSIPTASSARACASAWSTTPPPNDHEYGTTIPTFIRARLPASREQSPTTAPASRSWASTEMPTPCRPPPRWKSFSPAQPEPRHEVLEVGHRGRRAAEHGGVERAAPRREQAERDEAAADLEAPVGNVLVRHLVAGDVQRRAEQQRERTRADERSQRRPGRDVQRDDHARIIAYAPRR